MATIEDIRRHYNADTDETQLAERVRGLIDGLSREELLAASDAGFDQFHTRGIAATAELAQLAGVTGSLFVLDAGSGFGGPARYLARHFGCQVRGIDLTPAFVSVATLLTERMGLDELARFEVGDLAALPFADASFDLVWTQHVVMNVPNRDRVYAELRRVLKADGKLAFYDILAADGGVPPQYPVPWAQSAATSFLLTEAETRASLARAGFAATTWNDVTADMIAWIGAGGAVAATHGLTLGSLLEPGFPEMATNVGRSARDGAIRVVMGLANAS